MADEEKADEPTHAPETPTCQCLLLCEDVLESKAKGRLTLIGVLGGIVVAGFPAKVGGFVVFAKLSNIYGNQPVYLRLARADETGTALRTQVNITADGPLGSAAIIATVPMMSVESPGRYILSLLWRDEASKKDVTIQDAAFDVLEPKEEEED